MDGRAGGGRPENGENDRNAFRGLPGAEAPKKPVAGKAGNALSRGTPLPVVFPVLSQSPSSASMVFDMDFARIFWSFSMLEMKVAP